MIDQSSDRRNRIITVIGGGGFVGRYVCERLLRHGVRLRVAQRNTRQAYFLQPLARVGQIELVPLDMARPEMLDGVIEGSWGVVNLAGAFSGELDRIHSESPGRAAEFAAATGTESFVHVSAIGADSESESGYAASKGRGEAAVRSAFPGATIIRPSLVFGPEDQLTNRFARMAGWRVLPVLAAERRFQPVYVRDLAEAIAIAALDPGAHGGTTYEIGGPQVMTMAEINRTSAEAAGRTPQIVALPNFIGEGMSRLGFLPGAPMTRDQWLMLGSDNVAKGPGLEAFGIAGTPMAAAAPEWLGRFRKGGRFSLHKPSRAAF